MPRAKKKPPAKKAAAKKAAAKKAVARKQQGVRVAALNVYVKNSLAQQKADLKKAMAHGDVVALSEVKSNGLLKWARSQGWGVYRAEGKAADSALIWNRTRVSLARPGQSLRLNKIVGDDGGERSRFAAYAMFTDIKTGSNFWAIAAHTVPMDYDHSNPNVGPEDRRQRRRIRAEQYDTLGDLARQLSKSGAAVVLAGDLNAKDPRLNIGGQSGQGWDRMYVLGTNGDTYKVSGVQSDHPIVVSSLTLAGGDGKQKLGQYGWVQGMDRDEARAADIVGGPGLKPVKPVEADYEPGGRFYGIMAYSVALKHYQHALDGYRNGYWYHANGLAYTRAQRDHNVALAASGKFNTKFGLPSATYAEQLGGRERHGYYSFENGMWVYRARQPMYPNPGGGDGTPGDGDGGSGPRPGGLTEYRGIAGVTYTPPVFTGYWQGDMGGGPQQVAPGAPPKQNGQPLFNLPPAPAPSTPTTPTTPTTPPTGGIINVPTDPSERPNPPPPLVPAEQYVYDWRTGRLTRDGATVSDRTTYFERWQVRSDLDFRTLAEMVRKVSTGYFEDNPW